MIKLTPPIQRFIVHWGEMGSKWGTNRTVAQIYALLYISPDPLNAEDIAEALQVARSNVSTSLKELQNWGIVKPVHTLGDRREYYHAVTDVYEMSRAVLDRKKQREVDPTFAVLKECIAEMGSSNKEEKYARERLEDLNQVFETVSGWYEKISKLPIEKLLDFLTFGRKKKR